MPSRIKGINIEINGDTTGLQKALSEVDKHISNTQKQLKDVEKLLKLDPTNTELLAQKQKLLSEAINSTKERLETLKTASEQAKKQLEIGNISQEQYDALQREIASTEQSLQKLESQAEQSKSVLAKFGEVGKTLQDVGGKMTDIGKTMSTHVTAPIVAVGAAAIASFKEVDKASDTLIAKTGASGEALEKMQDIVTNLATSIPTDFETAGTAVGEVATRFDDVGDSLEELSGQFIKFAQVNGVDVNSAIDSVQASMAAFGVDTKDASAVLDTLNKIGQDTGVNVQKLTDDMTKNAGVLKEMGLGYSDAATLLAGLNKEGIDASTVTSGLKKAWAQASKDGKSMQQMLEEMSDGILNAKTDTEAYQYATEIFGSKAGPAIAEACRTGRLSLDQLGTSLTDNAGNLNETFDAMQDPLDQTSMIFNELKAIGADLASTMQTLLMPVFEKIRGVLKTVREAWANLDDKTKENIVTIAGVVAAVGPALVIIGKVVSAVGTVMSAVSACSGVLTAIAGVISGPVVLAIGAAIAAGVAIVANWDTIKSVAATVWEAVKTTIVTVWEAIKSAVTAAVNAVKSAIDTAWNAIKSAASTAWNAIKTAITNAWNAIKTAVTNAVNAVKTALDKAWNTIKSAASTAWNAIKSVITGVWDSLKSTVSSAVESVKSTLSKAWDTIKSVASTAWEGVKSTVSTAWDNIKSAVGTATAVTASVISTAWDGIKSTAGSAWDGIKSTVSSAWEGIRSTTSSVAGTVSSAMSSAWSSISSTTSTVWNSIKSTISDVMDNAKRTVSNAIERIRGLFDFKWEFPKLKLPHFTIKGSFSLNPPSVPTLGIDWYAKAMKNGMILNNPTIFGAMNGKLLGGGEAGSEAVVGTKSLMEMIQRAVDVAGDTNYGGVTVNVYGAPGQDVNQLATIIEAKINASVKRKGAVFA